MKAAATVSATDSRTKRRNAKRLVFSELISLVSLQNDEERHQGARASDGLSTSVDLGPLSDT